MEQQEVMEEIIISNTIHIFENKMTFAYFPFQVPIIKFQLPKVPIARVKYFQIVR